LILFVLRYRSSNFLLSLHEIIILTNQPIHHQGMNIEQNIALTVMSSASLLDQMIN
jgi:hypothetical protein